MNLFRNFGLIAFIVMWLASQSLAQEISPSQSLAQELTQVIEKFSDKIYTIAETTGGDDATWSQAEKNALIKIEEILKRSPDAGFEKADDGDTPFQKASEYGYYFIVEKMMISKNAALHINDKNKHGLTAFEYSELAIFQTLIACHPKIENPFVFVPYLIKLPYYENRRSYQKLGVYLAENGADTSIINLKNFWLEKCSNQNTKHRASVNDASKLRAELFKMTKENFIALDKINSSKNLSNSNGITETEYDKMFAE